VIATEQGATFLLEGTDVLQTRDKHGCIQIDPESVDIHLDNL
jgi:hypothetical protein